MSQHGLKKVQLQERYTLVTQDSIGHLKTLCMSVLLLAVALESEWKPYSSSQSVKKNTSVLVWIQLKYCQHWVIETGCQLVLSHNSKKARTNTVPSKKDLLRHGLWNDIFWTTWKFVENHHQVMKCVLYCFLYAALYSRNSRIALTRPYHYNVILRSLNLVQRISVIFHV